MKDNWLNKLIVAVVLFVAIIIVGLLSMRKPALKYELTGQQTLAAITSQDEQISPEKANQLQLVKDPTFQFVDLRSPNEFLKGHAQGALNIPQGKLLSKENLELIKLADKDNKTLILYGTDQSQATAPCLLLKQLGFEKVKVLRCDYAYLTGKHAKVADSLPKQSFDAEAAHYNFAKIGQRQAKTEKGLSSKTLPQKVITKPKPISTAPAAGGC